MSANLVETLPLPLRLALSYAPRVSRGATLAVLALDARLAGIVRTGGEPVIAQMKLAWWRERLAQDVVRWPAGEPLLALLGEQVAEPAALVPLVDGWEALLAERLDAAVVEQFAGGRAAMWLAVAAGVAEASAAQAAREWAMLDLALNLGTEAEADTVRAMAASEPWNRPRLARHLRPLTVLHGLARRALRRKADSLLDGPAAMLTALQLGIVGR